MGKIESRNLTWHIDGMNRAILEDVNIELEPGNIYGIIGPNGSGKTTLLRHIMRLVRAAEGGIYYDGININNIKRKQLAEEFALVPQNTAADTQFTAWEVVMMGRNPHIRRFSAPSGEDKDIVTGAMKRTDCYSYKDKIFSSLSGGEAQRTVCARAVAQETPWILLDEPVSSLDIKHQISVMELLSDLNKNENKSVAIVLHDINLAACYCTHIIMMKNGKVFCSGRTEDVITTQRLSEVYDIAFTKALSPKNDRSYFMPVC